MFSNGLSLNDGPLSGGACSCGLSDGDFVGDGYGSEV